VLKNSIKRALAGVYFACGFLFVLGNHLQAQAPLGATVLSNNGGVTFRVWAPNATSVAVAGGFNSWSAVSNSLVKESGTPWSGIWSNTVPAAKAGDQYKFVLGWPGTNGVYQLDPRSLRVVNDGTGNLNSVIYDQQAFDWGSNKTSPVIPDDQKVMYEMHVGTFYDPDPNDGKPGTFSNAITRLPYLQRLGINVIALMPVAEFFTGTSWGYNPQYLFAIEDSYGGPDAFKRFVKEAHRLGMKVQLDIVHNHYGSAEEVPELINFGGTNAYFFDTNTPIGRTKWGPRPNYTNSQVRAFIQDNVRMFLDDYGISGFRWDSPQNLLGYDTNSTSFSDVKNPQTVISEGKSLMMEINRMIHTHYPGRWSIAEDADLLSVNETYSGFERAQFFQDLVVTNALDSFDGHWQTSFHNIITPQIASSQPVPATINSKVNDWSEPPGYRIIFTDNHDKSGNLNILSDSNAPLTGWRLANRMDPSNQTVVITNGQTNLNLLRTNSMVDPVTKKRVLLNAVLTFTAPGVPMLWMGQEFGATDTFSDGSRMDWREASRQSEVFRTHRDLILLRTNLPALRLLSLAQSNNFSTQGGVLAYWHTNGSSSNQVYIALNFSSNSTDLPLSNLPTGTTNTNWFIQMHTDWNLYGGSTPVSTNPLTRTQTLLLPAYSAAVLANTRVVSPSRLTNTQASVSDGWMNLFGVTDPNADDDQDGLSNLWESQNGLDPLEKDTATVALDGVTNNLRAESNNPNVQFIFWATSAVTTPRFPTFRFLSNSITGANFTNPSGGYVRLSFNLTNSNSTASFFSPNTNLAVVDTNRTNWATFHGINNLNANADTDTFSNLQEFGRGSDPSASNRATICLAGQFNGWNASANPMSFAGGGLWVGYVPGRQGASEVFKFTDGTWDNDWGDSPPTNSIADYKGTNITISYSNGNGMYRFAFDENTLAYQVGYDPTDANGDGIQDAWIGYYGLTGGNALATADPDADGWSNLAEFKRFTNANGTFMNPAVSDTNTTPKRMTVTGNMAPLPSWQPNANNMIWSDQKMQWEWTGTFTSSGTLQFKFSQASATNWSGGDSWGWNVGASNAGIAVRSGSNNILAPVTNGGRYRFGFNDLTGIYSISNYPVSSEWWESNGLPLPLPTSSSDPRWAQDTDGDGNSQLMEYALGGNPNLPQTNRLISSWATNQGGSNRLVLRWTQRTNAVVNPEWQTGLVSSNWTNLTSSDIGGVTNGMQSKEASVPIDSTNQKFIRLRVTGP